METDRSGGLSAVQSDLIAFRKHVAFVEKRGTNAHFKYAFATIEDVTTAVREGLEQFNLCLVSTQIVNVVRWTHGDRHHTQVHIRVGVGRGSEIYYFEGIGEGCDPGDKGSMKAMAAGTKYAFKAAGLISFGDDPEADAATDSPPKVTAPMVLDRIASATNEEQLLATKMLVLSLKGTEAYRPVVDTYKAKEKELEA